MQECTLYTFVCSIRLLFTPFALHSLVHYKPVIYIFFCFTDCRGVETNCEEIRFVEDNTLPSPPLRCWNGDDHFCSHSDLLVVSIHIYFPDTPFVQPGLQQRFGDFTYPCWQQSKCRDVIVAALLVCSDVYVSVLTYVVGCISQRLAVVTSCDIP